MAIRQLDPKMQNTYRHLAAKQNKQILNSNRHNTHHKRQQYSINQIKRILENNNLTLVKADKSKAVVIMDKETVQLTPPHSTHYRNTKHMLPPNHDG